ncbi:MAG: nucleoside hydrolase [Thomasclavelia ramosa]|nr:nucleoside hydrolase [Thomasclavelia ramosa]
MLINKIRIIICSDAKNEADDQYALVHAMLTNKFIIKGLVAGHFRDHWTNHLSYAEMVKLAKLTNTYGEYPIVLGADQKLVNIKEYEVSAGTRLIIEEALKEDSLPLYVLNIGALTDLAVALLEEPKITSKMTAIWVGGGRYPKGSKECNLGNDLIAANYVFASELSLWQIPSNVYKTTLVSLAQLKLRVAPMGKLGNYLYEQLITFMKTNAKEKSWINPECWVMGDSGAIGVLLEEQKSYYQEIIAPIFDEEHHYIYNQKNRKIRVYQQLNNYFVIEDMLSKIELFASEGKRWHF